MCYPHGMTRIGIRELRQHASRYLERVKAGEVIEVTERGKLIALLVSPTPAVAARDRLIASGRLIAARETLRIPTHRHAARSVNAASQALTELREDRLG